MVRQAPLCQQCGKNPAQARWDCTRQLLCAECYIEAFETTVHDFITETQLFHREAYVAVGCSGGKDSTALLHCLYTLNERYDYGIRLGMVAVDEGIAGYRDKSLECVYALRDKYKLPLEVTSFREEAGADLDEVVARSGGPKQACSVCGVLRRRCLSRGAALLGCDCIVTGHNGDDCAETVIMNLLRGDATRLIRCAVAKTPHMTGGRDLPRLKPFRCVTQKEVVLYAHLSHLYFFSVECPHSSEAFRAYPRRFLVEAACTNPMVVRNVIRTGEVLAQMSPMVEGTVNVRRCERCGEVSTRPVCTACRVVEQLKAGLTTAEIFKE